ncbi:hypothetical protein AB7X09_08965, partial [Providencia rettgeri]
SLRHLCCSEVSISPLFRWPNLLNHYNGLFKALHVDNAIEFSGGPYAAIAIKDDSFTIYGGIRTKSSCPDNRVWCSAPTNENGQPGATPAWLGISNR